jgi:peptidoglycan/LPS O-acetylase OafA/YrhL
MLESWANTIVIGALGLGIGGVTVLSGQLLPDAYEEATHSWKKGEKLIAGVRRRQEEQDMIMRSPEARPARWAIGACYALVAVLVLSVWLSPVNLGWWTLLISVVAGGALVALAFRLARAHKLPHLRGPSFLDPYSKAPQPKP